MSAQVSFDSLRFRRAIARVAERHQAVGGKRIGFLCPTCTARNRITVEQVAQQVAVNCVGCGKPIAVSDERGGFGRLLQGK